MLQTEKKVSVCNEESLPFYIDCVKYNEIIGEYILNAERRDSQIVFFCSKITLNIAKNYVLKKGKTEPCKKCNGRKGGIESYSLFF
jgi:hypothetical protein